MDRNEDLELRLAPPFMSKGGMPRDGLIRTCPPNVIILDDNDYEDDDDDDDDEDDVAEEDIQVISLIKSASATLDRKLNVCFILNCS